MIESISKARTLREIQAKLTAQESLYDQIIESLKLVNSYKEPKEWDRLATESNVCSNKIDFFRKQLDAFVRTGRLMGDYHSCPSFVGKYYFDGMES